MDGGGGESSTSTKSKASGGGGGGGAAAAAIEDDILLAAEAHCYDEQQEKDCNGERSEDIFFAHLTHTHTARLVHPHLNVVFVWSIKALSVCVVRGFVYTRK